MVYYCIKSIPLVNPDNLKRGQYLVTQSPLFIPTEAFNRSVSKTKIMRDDKLRLVHVTILASICTNMWVEHTTRGGVHTKYHFGILAKLGMFLLKRSWIYEIIVGCRQRENSHKTHSWMLMLYLSSVGDVCLHLLAFQSQIMNLKIPCWTTAGDDPSIQVQNKGGALG